MIYVVIIIDLTACLFTFDPVASFPCLPVLSWRVHMRVISLCFHEFVARSSTKHEAIGSKVKKQ